MSSEVAAIVGKATEAEAIEGADNTKSMTPARVAVVQEKYDVRRAGADTANADNSTEIQAAIDLVGAANGILRIPDGDWDFGTTLDFDANHMTVTGDDERGSVLKYTGSGTAVTISATQAVVMRNLGIEDTGTGTHGLVIGPPAELGFRHVVDNVDIRGFSTYGLHAAYCEFLQCNRVAAYSNGIGFRIDNSTAGTGMANSFHQCRSQDSTNEGWWIDKQISPRFIQCEAINSGGTYQFRTVYVYQAVIDQLDAEDTTDAHTKVGLRFIGEYSTISVMTFGLATGIQILSSPGCYIGPSRFSSVTKPIDDLGSNTALTVYDGGNFGTSTFATSADELNFIGQRLRSEFVQVSGAAGAGYIEFVQEQSSDPAAPSANRARLFTKDNGAGKTQLAVRFASGATQVFATEP
jgi:hypothetical protein